MRISHPDLDYGYYDCEVMTVEEAVRRCARANVIPERDLWLTARIELPDWTGAVFQGLEGKR